MRRSSRAVRYASVLFVLAVPAHLPAQGASRSAAILLLRGADTVVVERVFRTETLITTTVAGPGSPRLTIVYRTDGSFALSEASFSVYGPATPPDAPPLQAGTVRIVGDSAHLAIRQGTAPDRALHLATKQGALLLANNDFTALEQLVRKARRDGVQRLVSPLFALTGGATVEGVLELLPGDSARFSVGGNVTDVALDRAGNVAGGSVRGAGVRIVVVEGPNAAKIALGAPDYSAPADAPYVSLPVVVPTKAGHTLAGTLTLPKVAKGRLPAVVTITGSGMQDRDEFIPLVSGYRLYRQVADTLSRRGIAVLRMDDRGVGGSGGDVNGTSADFADDIRAGVAWLRSRADIDPKRIALVGHSEGGMIAPMLAATDPALAAIVLMAGPSWTGKRVIDYQLGQAVDRDTAVSPAKRDSALAVLHAQFDSGAARLPWMKFFVAYDPVPTLKRVRQPVLILQGATDRQVAAEQAGEIAAVLRSAGNTKVTTRVFPERNHLFVRDPDGSPSGYGRLPSGRVDGEVLGTLADWLATVLRAK